MSDLNSTSAYETLKSRFHRLAALQGAQAVLHWDRATMMPEGGARARAEQQAALAMVGHEMLTSPQLADLVASAEETADALPEWDRANLSEMRRLLAHANATPADLVERLARARSETEMIWRSARAANDYASLAPALQRLLDLTRAQGDAKGAALGLDPYDALLDGYDPNRRAAEIDRLFAELESFLPTLLQQVMEAQKAGPARLPSASIFVTGGSMSATTPSPAACRTTAGSPRATTRRTSPKA